MSRPTVAYVLAGVCLAAAPSYAVPLPVIINMVSAGDQRSEPIQESVGNLHITKTVGLSIAVVPCIQSAPPFDVPSGICRDDESLHRQYQEWTYEHPTLIDVGQQGRDNSEFLASLSASQQEEKIRDGYEALTKWGLAYGKPTFFASANSSANTGTLTIIDGLGFQTYAQPSPSGFCSSLGGNPNRDDFCNSVKLCASGSGSGCVLHTYSELQTAINARASDGAVFVTFSPADLSQADGTLSSSKFSAYSALLDSFAADTNYVMRTFDTYYRAKRAIALPTAAPAPGYPVIFESDDARDGLYEAVATDLFLNRHVPTNVPLSQATVTCGPGSTESPFSCFQDSFHTNYPTWIADHPGLLEIVQHGTFHTEHNLALSRDQQLMIVSEGLGVTAGWGLPNGRPFAYAAPFSEVNSDTISVLKQLGFHTVIENAGQCPFSEVLNRFCDSVPVCQLSGGNRVEGPDCVLRSSANLITDVNALRPTRPAAFVVYHVQDMTLPNNSIDSAKMTAFQAILSDFHSQEVAGNFDLTTYDAYYRSHATDVIFRNGFETGNLNAWSASTVTNGTDLSVTAPAALDSTSFGLQALVNGTNSIFAEDDSPQSENRYRARFYFNPNNLDPGEGSGHFRLRNLIAFDYLNQRVITLVLRRISGAYFLRARVRLDDGTRADTAFIPITDAEHSIEFDWQRSSTPTANDGHLELFIDGSSVANLTALDNNSSAIESVRMGLLTVKSGASGTAFFDQFESRRASLIGP